MRKTERESEVNRGWIKDRLLYRIQEAAAQKKRSRERIRNKDITGDQYKLFKDFHRQLDTDPGDTDFHLQH